MENPLPHPFLVPYVVSPAVITPDSSPLALTSDIRIPLRGLWLKYSRCVMLDGRDLKMVRPLVVTVSPMQVTRLLVAVKACFLFAVGLASMLPSLVTSPPTVGTNLTSFLGMSIALKPPLLVVCVVIVAVTHAIILLKSTVPVLILLETRYMPGRARRVYLKVTRDVD